jgi:hypothetical protein
MWQPGRHIVPLVEEDASTEFIMEHRMGFEPMNTGFADQRVSHFATGAHWARLPGLA